MLLKEKYPHLSTKDFQYLNKFMRTLTLWFSPRKIVFERALIKDISRVPSYYRGKSRKFYKCADCGVAFKKGDVEVDHIDGIVMSECKDWNEYMSKILCSADRLQILCQECHEFKNMDDDFNLGSLKDFMNDH